MSTKAAADFNMKTATDTMDGSVVWWRTQRSINVAMGTLIVAIVLAAIWWFFFHPYVSTDDARVAATLVRVAPSKASGRVVVLNVEEGSRVKKGDVLAELDHRIYEADVQRAQARSELAQRELQRISQLVKQHSLPQRDLDNARASAEAADADLKLAQVNLENTYLRSPFDGIVVQKMTEIGNILEAGQPAVTVADMGHAWIAANVEETDIADVRPGQPVSINVDEGGELHGHVLEVRDATAAQFALIPSDNGAGNYTKVVQRIPIKVAIDGPSARPLRVGQSVEIKIRVR